MESHARWSITPYRRITVLAYRLSDSVPMRGLTVHERTHRSLDDSQDTQHLLHQALDGAEVPRQSLG